MDHFNGAVWASHHNCRALVDHNRQLADEQIKELVSRGAVIGGALDAWMMVPNWVRGKSTPKAMGATLEVLIDHLDHICQLAGNSKHIGLGTDLDGGYGTEQSPADLDIPLPICKNYDAPHEGIRMRILGSCTATGLNFCDGCGNRFVRYSA
ncbi:MAG: membrane dipeptidase [Saprospiraceae bacterium]